MLFSFCLFVLPSILPSECRAANSHFPFPSLHPCSLTATGLFHLTPPAGQDAAHRLTSQFLHVFFFVTDFPHLFSAGWVEGNRKINLRGELVFQWKVIQGCEKGCSSMLRKVEGMEWAWYGDGLTCLSNDVFKCVFSSLPHPPIFHYSKWLYWCWWR